MEARRPPMPVLIVDDDVLVRDLLRTWLAIDERFVLAGEASTGQHALDIANRIRTIGGVILDCEMPDGTGLEILPPLRQLLPGARIVLFSSDLPALGKAPALGADAAVAKTTPLSDLLDLLLGDAAS